MTDREMLGFAAKAYVDKCWHDDAAYMQAFLTKWNPLTDDGDALRLAVALEMHIALFGGAMESRVLADGDDWEVEGWECGKEEATRRAITRAAAQIGKEM